MSTARPVSSDELHAHIRRVIEYLERDEQRHFEECYLDDEFRVGHRFTKEQKQHIFYNVTRLKAYLEQP